MSDIEGKRVLITGATAGIGKETARGLLASGALVSLVGRNREKTERVVDELKRSTGRDGLDYFLADLSSLAEVRRLGAEVLARHGRLSVLINNAGGMNTSRVLTADGHELTFALNHLSPFLLTQLLMPALEAAKGARVISLSSDMHRMAGPLDFDDLMSARGRYWMYPVYGRAKLATVLFTRELARRLAGTPIAACCVHPGAVNSDFLAKPGFWAVMGKLSAPFLLSAEKGAAPSVHLASCPDAEFERGAYYSRFKVRAPASWARDDAAAARLWQVSEALTGLRAQA